MLISIASFIQENQTGNSLALEKLKLLFVAQAFQELDWLVSNNAAMLVC